MYEIDEQTKNLVIELIANSVHPASTFAQVHAVIAKIQNLKKIEVKTEEPAPLTVKK